MSDPKYDHYDFPTTNADDGPGHPGHTTPEEDAKVVELRTELEKEGHKERLDTLTMVRFSFASSAGFLRTHPL